MFFFNPQILFFELFELFRAAMGETAGAPTKFVVSQSAHQIWSHSGTILAYFRSFLALVFGSLQSLGLILQNCVQNKLLPQYFCLAFASQSWPIFEGLGRQHGRISRRLQLLQLNFFIRPILIDFTAKNNATE